MRRVHDLKVWPEFFEPLLNSDKTFEVRRDDRGFNVGDTLRLREWDGVDGYSDREVVRVVTYILAGPLFGVEPGVVIMALAAVHGLPSSFPVGSVSGSPHGAHAYNVEPLEEAAP